MKTDIHKLGLWLEQVCKEGIAADQSHATLNDRFAIVEGDRLLRQRATAPALRCFRDSAEERFVRESEGYVEPFSIDRISAGGVSHELFGQMAEDLARSGREMVRFQRWLVANGETDYTYAPRETLIEAIHASAVEGPGEAPEE